ncbi:Uncharacterised protein [BD1-7 clade bacterium]|uniref:Uncharacterized protein n=1 Tax=BD1-7 clade bacterium TaxID=2029982 RepID=A0A5S9PVM2_9GAMM|nr:Uncharacterised protein [BD1-7 clade bacterium]
MTQILRTSKDVRIIDNRLGFTFWRWQRHELNDVADKHLLVFAHDEGSVVGDTRVSQVPGDMHFLCPNDMALYSDFDIAIQYFDEYQKYGRIGYGEEYQNRYLSGFCAEELMASNDAVRRVIWRVELEHRMRQRQLADLVFVHACVRKNDQLDLAALLDVLPDIASYSSVAFHSSRRMFVPDDSAVVYLPKPVLRHQKQRRALDCFG